LARTGGRHAPGEPANSLADLEFFRCVTVQRKSDRQIGRSRAALAYRGGMEEAIIGGTAGPAGGDGDAGWFGPDSVSWRVLREGAVVVGGVRALLMHAAHPLVVAGARQTGMYERDPWRRLERTLRQTFTVVFGTRQEAAAASRRIDDIHGAVKGIDPVTGLPYDARDPDLLLWVHACLVSSFLELERRTIGKLDDAGRQRFHEEQMLTAEPLRLPRERIPATVAELDAYLDGVIASGILRRTEAADAVAELVRHPPRQVPRRRLWRLVSLLAFHTLPAELRRLYGVRHDARHELAVRAIGWAMRHDRPLMPPRWRFIAPALLAGARLRGEPVSVADAGLFLPLRDRGQGPERPPR
jgi:uncharacterized protein (DUF2236 family)